MDFDGLLALLLMSVGGVAAFWAGWHITAFVIEVWRL